MDALRRLSLAFFLRQMAFTLGILFRHGRAHLPLQFGRAAFATEDAVLPLDQEVEQEQQDKGSHAQLLDVLVEARRQ